MAEAVKLIITLPGRLEFDRQQQSATKVVFSTPFEISGTASEVLQVISVTLVSRFLNLRWWCPCPASEQSPYAQVN